jgi:hypothetical protein
MSLPAWPRLYQSLRHALQGQVPGVGILMLGMGGLGLFAWIPLSYYRMVMWPLILLWQAGFALILGWLIWRLRQFERPFRPLGYGWDGVMVATVLGLGLSAWGAPFKAIALWQLAWVLAYGLLLYGLRNGLGTGWLTATNLWRAVAIAAGVSAAISLSFWRPTPGMWAAGNFAAAIRNAQPLGHHNFVGGYFALTLPLVVSLAVAERQWRRWLAAIAAVLGADGPLCQRLTGGRPGVCGLGWGERDQPLLAAADGTLSALGGVGDLGPGDRGAGLQPPGADPATRAHGRRR